MKIKTIVDSNYYHQLTPDLIEHIKEKASQSGKYSSYFNYFHFNYKEELSLYSENIGQDDNEFLFAPATITINYTATEIYQIMKEVLKIVQETDEYTEYSIYKLFENKQRRFWPPPGTLRFYSKDLICFYTGKDWRKFKP